MGSLDCVVTTKLRSTKPLKLTLIHPLPHIEEMLSLVGGGTVLSTLNLAQAYQQVMLDEHLKEMFTITSHKDLYHMNHLQFSLAFELSMFQWISYRAT